MNNTQRCQNSITKIWKVDDRHSVLPFVECYSVLSAERNPVTGWLDYTLNDGRLIQGNNLVHTNYDSAITHCLLLADQRLERLGLFTLKLHYRLYNSV